MAQRNRLRGVADALLGSFASRNNDLDGYWAIGQLRSFADSNRVSRLLLDLLHAAADPDGDIPRRVALSYEAALRLQLPRFGIPLEWVREATIELTFGGDLPRASLQEAYGNPFSCVVTLVDDRGRSQRREHLGHCAPHDARREGRRGGYD